MKNKLNRINSYFVLTGMMILFSSCKMSVHNEPEQQLDITAITTDRIHNDTIIVDDTLNNKTVDENRISPDLLKSIRSNFKRINSIISWTTVDTIDMYESSEGGETVYFYQNKKLEKFITRYFGEMVQQLTEYYMMDGQLSFVFEKQMQYNRPIYYDASEMQENNDTEYFDYDKSVIIETRSYFENGKLLYQIYSQNKAATSTLADEQKRILTEFKKLLKLSKKQ